MLLLLEDVSDTSLRKSTIQRQECAAMAAPSAVLGPVAAV